MISVLFTAFFPLGFSACANDRFLTIQNVTWVPASPVAGTAAYALIAGRSPVTDFVRVTYCDIQFNRAGESTGATGDFPCFYGLVQDRTEFRVQTGAVWVPVGMTGDYGVEVRLKDEAGGEQGCGTGAVTVQHPGDGLCRRDGLLSLGVETWIPINPVVGKPAYLVLEGGNESGTVVDVWECKVEAWQGRARFGSTGAVPCYVGIVENGGKFRVQTGAVWVPNDVPIGEYTSVISAYNSNGEEIGCWQGVVTLVN